MQLTRITEEDLKGWISSNTGFLQKEGGNVDVYVIKIWLNKATEQILYKLSSWVGYFIAEYCMLVAFISNVP